MKKRKRKKNPVNITASTNSFMQLDKVEIHLTAKGLAIKTHEHTSLTKTLQCFYEIVTRYWWLLDL